MINNYFRIKRKKLKENIEGHRRGRDNDREGKEIEKTNMSFLVYENQKTAKSSFVRTTTMKP